MDDLSKYGLDLHCTMILEEYRESLPALEQLQQKAVALLRKELDDTGIIVSSIDSRIKTEASLAGKLELKGSKYRTLSDLTDILGIRVVAFYTDDVDKIAALVGSIFKIDWSNSVDKRKIHQIDSFGYNSLHYICTHPDFPDVRFEVQMRTALQHVWATMYHDTGYKSGVEVPAEHIRNLNRLAGMLELADDEFSRTRTMINDYRRSVEALVKDGRFEEVGLNVDTYKSYLELKPFDHLARRIAAINQAEVHYGSSMPYLKVLREMGVTNLGEIENMIKADSEDAYALATKQIAGTDLDIISSTVAIQDLCIVHILKNGGGLSDLTKMFDSLGGSTETNKSRAQMLISTCSQLSFMNI